MPCLPPRRLYIDRCITTKSQRPVNRPGDHCCPDLPGALECTEQACSRQPRMQISKLQTTSSEQKRACRPTGVKKLHACQGLFFFPFSFPSLFLSYSFLEIKHSTTVQNFLLFFFKWNTSLTPYRHDKTTSWPPHKHKRTSTSSLKI